MRALSITLYANDGQGGLSTSQSVTGKIENLGKLSWVLDEEYSKFQPGTLTVRVLDEDEAVWTWIDSQLSTAASGQNQLFPAWVVLNVVGVRRILGLLDMPSVKRGLKSRLIDLSVQDWSASLRDTVVDGAAWERPFPRVAGGTRGFPGPFQAMPFIIYTPVPGALYVNPAGSLDLQEGDTIRHQPTGTGFVVGPLIDGRLNPGGTGLLFNLTGWTGEGYNPPWTFTRDTTMDALSDQHYYIAQAGLEPDDKNPVYSLQFDTVDQLTPGDVLTTVSGGEIKINDVDSERGEVISLDPISAAVTIYQKLYLSQESRETLIYADAGELLRRAAMPFPVDLSRFTTPTLPRPILAWLPARSNGQDMRGPRDLEPTASALRVWGTGNLMWTGTPEAGWTAGTASVRTVPWTSQLLATPASLMPDEMPALAPDTGYRHRSYYDWKYVRPMVLDSAWRPVAPQYVPALQPATILCHDYNQFRRLIITGGSVMEQRWTGSTWTAGTTTAWPVPAWSPAVAVPMPGVPATTGPVAPQGQAILAICGNGVAWELQLAFAGTTARLPLDASLAGAQLRTTPWGAYLLGPGGFGRITYAGGSLSLAWAPVRGAGQAVLLPSTFAAIDASALWCMAQFTTLDTESKPQTEVHLLQLTPTPDPTGTTSPLLSSEMISRGAPRLAMATKDPSAPRLVGMLGGRMFQVAAKLPATIERVRAYGMTAAELIEHIAQALCAIAVPLPTGMLQMVSRAAAAPVALTADRLEVTQSRQNQYFFSAVRVSGQIETYADAYGAWAGGRVLEISDHPLLWTEGGCYGLAAVYAQFHGIPRREEVHRWFFEDANAAAPWETLTPWATLTVNGGSRTWFLTALEYDLVEGDATATLLEAAP